MRRRAGCRSTPDTRRRPSGQSDVSGRLLRKQRGLVLRAASIGLLDILPVCVSTGAASWWRMSESSQTDKKQE